VDVTATLTRGNHKSVRGYGAKLLEMLKDEAKRGWQLPLPKEAALELPLIEVAPLAMVSQTTIGADGAKETKLRLTHDQSFNASRGVRRSVNDRVVTERLTPARLGRALLRCLHYTCKLRRQFPDERPAADYEGGLQVRVLEGVPPGQDGRQVQHLHRGDVTSGLAHDVRRSAKSVAVERRFRSDRRPRE
jgi:hypothetical protein